jgi:dTDP-4-dehydrorhamnose 3,5-epimerase
MSDVAEFLYKTTDYYAPSYERSIKWNDPELAIAWPAMDNPPGLSSKDAVGSKLVNAELFD